MVRLYTFAAIFILGVFLGRAMPHPEAQAAVDYADAVRLAHQMGRNEAMYEKDDIGLVRLSVKDIEGLEL